MAPHTIFTHLKSNLFFFLVPLSLVVLLSYMRAQAFHLPSCCCASSVPDVGFTMQLLHGKLGLIFKIMQCSARCQHVSRGHQELHNSEYLQESRLHCIHLQSYSLYLALRKYFFACVFEQHGNEIWERSAGVLETSLVNRVPEQR